MPICRFNRLLGATLVVSALFTSCKAPEYTDIPTEEEYTRNFIREFGLIDPAQDFNMAQKASVAIDCGEHASKVKVYAKVGGKYFLVADLIDLSGSVDVPIDIPNTTKDLKVVIDGQAYYTNPGGKITAVARSRGIASDTGKSETFTLNGTSYTVTVGAAFATGDEEYFKFNAQQMGTNLASSQERDYDGGLINEGASYKWPDYYSVTPGSEGWVHNDASNSEIGRVPEKEGNVERSNVYQNIIITLEGNSFVMYPMYWYTSNSHKLSVYLIDDAGNPVKDASNNIITFPIYDAKADIETYVKTAQKKSHISTTNVERYVYNSNNYPEVETLWAAYYAATSDAERAAAVNALYLKIKSYYEDPTNTDFSAPTTWCGTCAAQITFDTFSGIEIASDANASYIYFTEHWSHNYEATSSEVPYNLLEDGNGNWTTQTNGNGAYRFKEELLMRSHGIKVTVNGWTGRLGMATTIKGPYTIYSQAAINRDLGTTGTNGYTFTPTGDEDEDAANALKQYSYAASYFHPITKRLFYSFEDWTGGSGDHDLNDMIFMIEGIDHLDTDKGEIPVRVTTENESSEPLSWIIAAEDLGATDDFDFNDVIFRLTSVTTNKNSTETLYGDVDKTEVIGSTEKTEIHKAVKIQALAAGGTLPVYLHFFDGTNDYVLGPNDKVVLNDGTNDCSDCEWHKWFGVSGTPMINTGYQVVTSPGSCALGSYSKVTVNGSVTESDSWQIEAFKNFTMADYSQRLSGKRVQGFYITVSTYASGSNMADITDGNVISANDPGAAPQMFAIPDVGANDDLWQWPQERKHILQAYDGFAAWVNEDNATTREWHKHPTKAILVTRPVK